MMIKFNDKLKLFHRSDLAAKKLSESSHSKKLPFNSIYNVRSNLRFRDKGMDDSFHLCGYNRVEDIITIQMASYHYYSFEECGLGGGRILM